MHLSFQCEAIWHQVITEVITGGNLAKRASEFSQESKKGCSAAFAVPDLSKMIREHGAEQKGGPSGRRAWSAAGLGGQMEPNGLSRKTHVEGSEKN